MSAPSNGYVYVKTWVLNNSKVYSFLLAPPIHYFLYAYVCSFLIRTHTASNAFQRDEKVTKQMGRNTPNAILTLYNNTLSILHFLTAGGSTPLVIMFWVSATTFIFFFFSILIICASSLFFLNVVPLLSLKSTVLRHVRKK